MKAMNRSSIIFARGLRGLALGSSLALLALAGCSNDGYEGKEFGQEFEKPANYPTESLKEPDEFPGEGEEASPRDKRGTGALGGEPG